MRKNEEGIKKYTGTLKMWMAAIALILICLCGTQKAMAASTPSITVKAATSLTSTNAQINATISNPSKTKLTRCGFILYNSAGKQLANKYDKISYTLKSFNAWFNLNSYYGKLSAGTTYKYKFYVMTSAGKYYYSALKSLTTVPSDPTVTLKSVTSLISTNAQINATVSNPSKAKLTRCGFILYNSAGKQLADKYDKISYTQTSFSAWFNLNSYYGKLTADTTYKYKFYVMTSAGKYYYSAMGSFTTLKVTKYNPSAAASYATKNASSLYKGGAGEWCAGFVAKCIINGGELSTLSYQSRVGQLATSLTSAGFKKYTLANTGTSIYAKGTAANTKIAVGDVIIYYCQTCSTAQWKHAAIVTKIDSNSKLVYITDVHIGTNGIRVNCSTAADYNDRTSEKKTGHNYKNGIVFYLYHYEG